MTERTSSRWGGRRSWRCSTAARLWLVLAATLLVGTHAPTAFAVVLPPTPTPTPFPCPSPTGPSVWVDSVVSPTDELSQVISVLTDHVDRIEITAESGTFVATGAFDYPDPAHITITLLPNTVHHLEVRAHVRPSQGGTCPIGGYTLRTTYDRFGTPVVIVQGNPAATPTPTVTPTIATGCLPDGMTVYPSSGPPGGQVGVSGLCYFIHSGMSGNIYFDAILVGTARGDTPGNYSSGFTVPSDAIPGFHQVRLVSLGGTPYQSAIFEVMVGVTPPASTPTPTITPTCACTPTLILTATPCPQATPEALFVDSVTSPTDQLSQMVTVHIGNGDRVEIRTESGTFATTGDFSGGLAQVTVALLPNTTHHLEVIAHVRAVPSPGGCVYGNYSLSTTVDRFGTPLVIVQQSAGSLTPTPTRTATRTPTVDDSILGCFPSHLMMTPSIGRPGDNVTVNGLCYFIHSGQQGTIYFDSIAVGTVHGDTIGNYTLVFMVPNDAIPGFHVVRLVSTSGDQYQSNTFEVTVDTTPPSPTPTATTTPDMGGGSGCAIAPRRSSDHTALATLMFLTAGAFGMRPRSSTTRRDRMGKQVSQKERAS